MSEVNSADSQPACDRHNKQKTLQLHSSKLTLLHDSSLSTVCKVLTETRTMAHNDFLIFHGFPLS